VAFELAMSVFRDPLAATILDQEHGDDEERWITLGVAVDGTFVLVVHTWVDAMKREYDFSNAARGKFHRLDMELAPPVYLEPGVLTWLTSHAQSKGTTLNELVNDLLKKDIELIETAK
jgi:hypothetical protein